MAVNKVLYGSSVLIDLSNDTVAADTLLQGIIAHDKTGAAITGTLEAGGGSAALTKGTATFFDSNVLVSSDVDFGELVSAGTEFYFVAVDDDLQGVQFNEVLFGHYTDGVIYLAYCESGDVFAYTTSEVTADSGTLRCDSMSGASFANCNYTVVYAEASSMPTTITAGDTPVLINNNVFFADRATAVQSTGLTLSITKAGTYRIKAAATNPYSASAAFSYKALVQFYVNGTAKGTLQTISGNTTIILSEDLGLNAGDTVEVYASSAHASYKVCANCLQACIDWNNGF